MSGSERECAWIGAGVCAKIDRRRTKTKDTVNVVIIRFYL